MKQYEMYKLLATKNDVLKYAKQVAAKQRDVKRLAIDRVVETYERALKMNQGTNAQYEFVNGYRCDKCGGIIMKVVSVFPVVTFGGNPAIGCIACSTVGSSKMLSCRDDITRQT